MNPANGVNSMGTFNGAGNAFPMIGTGNVFYTQVGYLAGKDILGDQGSIQPYMAMLFADYMRLEDNVLSFETGVNWFIHGTHQYKVTLNYQSRPVFVETPPEHIEVTKRMCMYVLQFQVSL